MIRGRRDHVHIDALVAQRHGQLQDERAGGVARLARKGVREEERAHDDRQSVWWVASSSTRRRSSRTSARWTAICSLISPVAKKTLPTMRHVWTIVQTARVPTPRKTS